MPRRENPFIPGSYYHIYNRGNNRQAVFFEPANYLYFLRGVKKYVRPVAEVVAYCLMPTHYHLLVRVKETPETPDVFKTSGVSLAMQKFLISYTKAINKRFDRVGALFQGQFQAKPVQTHSYLLNVCLYIHANPVKDRLVAAPQDWPYSNYREWLGQRNGTLVDTEFIREHFATPGEYQRLVMEYIETRCLPENVKLDLQAFE